jgi:hypothetical protein
MNAELELPFELAAAYSVARTVPRDKLLLSIHAKNGTSVLRLMGPGLKVELTRWSYGGSSKTRSLELDPVAVYNWKLTSKYIRKQVALPDGERTFLAHHPEGVIPLIRLLLKPENV